VGLEADQLIDAKALCTYMGHSSVTITYDRYGHLMPGNEDEAAALLDTYLECRTRGLVWRSWRDSAGEWWPVIGPPHANCSTPERIFGFP
jgi:hypothetical protein